MSEPSPSIIVTALAALVVLACFLASIACFAWFGLGDGP